MLPESWAVLYVFVALALIDLALRNVEPIYLLADRTLLARTHDGVTRREAAAWLEARNRG